MYRIKLSPYAKIFYHEWQLDPNSSRYNIVIDQILYGSLDTERLKIALYKYIAEHVLLNSHIQDARGELFWVKNTNINELDYSDNPVSTSELFSYIARGFDLHNQPLYRFKLFKMRKDVYRLVLIFHHLIVDGSASLDSGVFEAISSYYNDENYGIKQGIDEQIKAISSLSSQLSDDLIQHKGKRQKFWIERLSAIENVDLSFLKPGKSTNQKNMRATRLAVAREVNFSCSDLELPKLKQIKLQYGVTPYIYGQCVLALLLHKYTGYDRLAIGYPLTIREGMSFIYGAQINTNIIPYHFNQNTSIIDLFNQSKEFFNLTIHSVAKYGYYPITDIIQDGANKDLLNICFAQTFFMEHPLKLNGITKVEFLSRLNANSVPENAILFEHDARNNKLNYRIKYNKNSVNEDLLENFVASYKKLYSEILENLSNENTSAEENITDYPVLSPRGKQLRENKLISDCSILSKEQYQKIVHEFNDTDKDYPLNKTIHQLFEEQVLKTPDNIAIVYEDIKFTYKELNNKANQLAHYIRRHYNIKPDDLVMLCMDRNEQMLIAMLGVLKSGGAYVPVDPGYPNKHIGYILSNTNTNLILTNIIHAQKLGVIVKRQVLIASIVSIDNQALQRELSDQENSNPITMTTSGNLVYIIYTSGTIGKPKGVMIEHGNLVNFSNHAKSLITKTDNVMSYINYSFDAINAEIYPTLLNGNSLYIAAKHLRDNLGSLYRFIIKNNITFAVLPAIVATEFVSNYDLAATKINTVVVGGDVYKGQFTHIKIVNQYGPTEATVCATMHQYKIGDVQANIGKPINNTKCYVVDNKFNILPIGAVGELMISGECLARGYVNDSGLTMEKFIANPFQTQVEKSQNKNSRIYKTGDLVRMLPDGDLEYIGRNDSQVKIRGYRIELGEIENKLSDYPGVKQAIVLSKDLDRDRSLVAYYVTDEKLDEVKIYAYLTAELPEYMLPTVLIHLKQLPITINGKLNIRALPEPEFKNKTSYVAPASEAQQLICIAFTKILEIENIGVNDDFFLLGGNSIHAIRLVSILQANFDIKITDIFKFRTAAKLAEVLWFGKTALKQKLRLVKERYLNKGNYLPCDRHYDPTAAYGVRQSINTLDCFAKSACNDETTQSGRIVANKVDKQSQDKITDYLKNANKLPNDCFLQKPITNILLTGATGFLGCNILNQLLKSTTYNIFLPVRADSQVLAVERLNKKFKFYFDKTLDDVYGKRVFVLKSSLDQENLGLSQYEYQDLAMKIDSVIHAAALVKHYGDYDASYLANVQITINLLEFTKLTKLKDFHYISTRSVLDDNGPVSTEADMPDHTSQEHVYIKTKLQGEYQAIKYRDYDIKSNIYRVGNLAFMAENYRTQENIEENAFLNWMKCLFKLQCVASEISIVEISPVDLTAQAIVRLFDKSQLSNEIYHVFNPNLFDIAEVTTKEQALRIKVLPIEQFIDIIIDELESDTSYRDLLMKFLLRQGWLDDFDTKNITSVEILQNKTQQILEKLDFKWPLITFPKL